MTRRSFKTGRTLVKVAIDVDMTEFPALKASFIVMGMVMSEEGVIVAASPLNLGVGDSDLCFLGQRG